MHNNYNLIIGFFLSAICFISCTKDISERSPDILHKKQVLPKEILKTLSEKGVRYSIPLHMKIKGYISDSQGNPIQKSNKPKAKISSNTPLEVCDDPASYTPDVELTSVEKIYTCGYGYTLVLHWEITSEFYLTNANPTNSTQLSRGKIRLKDGSNNITYSNTNITPANPVYEGTSSGRYIFSFSYSTPYISSTTMNNATIIDNAFTVFTDCDAGGISISIPYISTYSFLTSEVTNPCVRVDNVYITVGGLELGYTGYIAGSDVTGSCTDAYYVHNTGSYVEYRAQGTTTWYPLPMYEQNNSTARTSGIVYYWEVNNLNLSGTYEFRYRNTYGYPNNTCSGAPWSSIITRSF